jgi:hypothetical protein
MVWTSGAVPGTGVRVSLAAPSHTVKPTGKRPERCHVGLAGHGLLGNVVHVRVVAARCSRAVVLAPDSARSGKSAGHARPEEGSRRTILSTTTGSPAFPAGGPASSFRSGNQAGTVPLKLAVIQILMCLRLQAQEKGRAQLHAA